MRHTLNIILLLIGSYGLLISCAETTRTPQRTEPLKHTNDTTSLKDDRFSSLISSMNLTFQSPKGYNIGQPKSNTVMPYDRVYMHPTERFEVRYALRPHDIETFRMPYELTLENISGQIQKNYTVFNKTSVEQEFGADVGASFMVNPVPEFANGYKYCLIVDVYKKGVGEVYMMYLADDNTIIADLMGPIFRAIQFK